MENLVKSPLQQIRQNSRQRSLNTVAMALFDDLVILSNTPLKYGADGGFEWQSILLFDVVLSF